jgi:uncharacterized RDD family membrane protein YckC
MEGSSGPESPAPRQGPQSPVPVPTPPPYTPPAPAPHPEAPPGYGGQMPPGGWQRSPIAAQPGGPLRAPLASWQSRLVAYVVDTFVVTVPASLLFFVGLGGALGDAGIWAALLAIVVWLLVVFVIWLVYGPVLMAREGEHNGQTWGKQLVRIRAVRDNGEEWTFATAALREVALKNVAVWVASFMFMGIPWFLNFFWPLWDDENRALHDMAASSHVVQA